MTLEDEVEAVARAIAEAYDEYSGSEHGGVCSADREAARAAITALDKFRAAGGVSDPWNPDPEDPFWMLEVRQGFDGSGSWLKNERTFLTTGDPVKALRFPSRFEAECARRRLPLEHSGHFEPTEHSWTRAAGEIGE